MNHHSDFNNLCRLCAGKTTFNNRIHIFMPVEKLNSILLKIRDCLHMEITEDDFLPRIICKDCASTVESYYEFRSVCVKTELFLKNLLIDTRQNIENFCQVDTISQDIMSQETYNLSSNFEKLSWPENDETEKIPTADLDNTECETTMYLKEDIISTNTIELKECITTDSNTHIHIELSQCKPVPALFRCHYCKLLFSTHRESIDHLKLEHKKIYKCNVCSDSFRSLEALEKHKEKYMRQTKEKEVIIENKKRKMRATEMQNKCKECGKQYKRNRELRLHERSHTGEKPYSCKYCNKTFAASSSRNKHVQVHEKRWSHVCSFCGKGFVDKIHFTYHVQKQHTGERPYACSQCDKKFVRKQDLKMHKLNFHSSKPRQCYKCEVCNNVYTTMSYLKQHKQIHELPLESRKKFKCNICDAIFLTNNKLKQHTLNHTGELPFECEICKKRYSSKMGLKIHLLIHSGIKKYVCEICSKPFALRNSLVCHRRTHTGERPYQCEICQQQFTQKSSLNTHRKRHSREEINPSITNTTWLITTQSVLM